jgi:NADH-quinone oxidoreductase subunit C
MNPADIHAVLQAKFPDAVLEFGGKALQPWVRLAPGAVAEVARFLRDEPSLSFEVCHCLSGMDYGDRLGVVYHLFSMRHRHGIVLRADAARGDPRVASVAGVWAAAEWHEREAYDMFGIRFDGHPDLRRILCPEDWEGWPLRKDYRVQEEYHGIRVPYAEKPDATPGTYVKPGPAPKPN